MISTTFLRYGLILLLSGFVAGCGGGGGEGAAPTPKTVTISWDANRESAVNSANGGYKVYYSSFSGFDINDSNVQVIDVPYSGGPASPTQTTAQLVPGHYYFRVVAYSSLNAPGSTGGSRSAPSVEYHYQVQ